MNSNSSRLHPPLFLLLRIGLAATFLYSAVHHFKDPIAFILKVSEYDILPSWAVEPFALVLPWAMAATSALLILGLLTRTAAGLQGLMLLSFIIAVAVNIYRDKVMGCGCFSEEGSAIGWSLVLQDLSLLIFCLALISKGAGAWSLDYLIYRRLHPPNPNPLTAKVNQIINKGLVQGKNFD